MIDTENKRRSVMPLYAIYTVPPVPDGTIDEADRPHARWIYAGLSYTGVVAAVMRVFQIRHWFRSWSA